MPLLGGTYDHTCLTHRADNVQLDALISDGIKAWGFSDCGYGDDIVGAATQPEKNALADAAPVVANGRTTTCTIRMNSANVSYAFPDPFGRRDALNQVLDSAYWRNVMTHEVGHCIGFGHMPYPSVMNAGQHGGITSLDVVAVRVLYPELVVNP